MDFFWVFLISGSLGGKVGLLCDSIFNVGGHTGTAGVRVRSNGTDQLNEREKRRMLCCLSYKRA